MAPPPVVAPRDVWNQAVTDWLDKEVQAGYTYTYIWMTNQLGHFTLGFLPVLLFDWLARALWTISQWHETSTSPFPQLYRYWFAGVLAVAWAGKEVRDVVVAEKEAANHAFPVDSGDLWKDAGTAVFFFWCGIIPAALSFFNPGYAVLSFVILLPIAAVGPAWYWMSRKLCFQRAQLPFLSRLADFTSGFSSASGRVGPSEIEAFVSALGRGVADGFQHLLIFGAANTGRSTLAVAIGTEHTFELRTGRYMTWTKFLDLDATGVTEDPEQVWPWREADILILDDASERSDRPPHVAVDALQAEIGCLTSDAVENLRRRRVVWVLGPLPAGEGTPVRWLEMFSGCLTLERARFGVVEVTGGFTKARVPVSSLSGH